MTNQIKTNVTIQIESQPNPKRISTIDVLIILPVFETFTTSEWRPW